MSPYPYRESKMAIEHINVYLICHSLFYINVNINLAGGFKHFLFSIIYGIILPIDSLTHMFQDG